MVILNLKSKESKDQTFGSVSLFEHSNILANT